MANASKNYITSKHLDTVIEESNKLLSQSKGSIVLVSGESGFGKSYALNYYFTKFNSSNNRRAVYSEAQSPIGKFNLGNLQPLFPFSKAIESMLNDDEVSPEKRFAKNIGLTVLASIPLIDSVFYAVKEIGKDWREFKKEKNIEKSKTTNSITLDYFSTLQSFASKTPIVLLMDDMHWADSQSIELLTYLAESINDIPLLIIACYKKSLTESQSLPLSTFLFKHTQSNNVKHIELETFTHEQISELARMFFDNYKKNVEFEDWIFEKSLGVPGVAVEFLSYFEKFSPFGPDGQLLTNFKGNDFLPSSVQSVFAQHLDILNDEEKNILSICSAEGREFTAVIISQLMNTDILTCIKKLKQLQSKTGIIKSMGAMNRYGIKTTVYKFTQQFYHAFFENSLEFEEYTALHAQIANLLKEKYEQAESENARLELAPYLAAHSAESGDDETARDMLLQTAQYASKYGNNDVIQNVYDKFKSLTTHNTSVLVEKESSEFVELLNYANTSKMLENSDVSATSDSHILQIKEFLNYRKFIQNEIIKGNFDAALNAIESVMNDGDFHLTPNEISQIKTLQLNIFSNIGDIKSATELYLEMKDNLISDVDEQHKCLIYNSISFYHFNEGNLTLAYSFLDKAVEIATRMPNELRLLTLANIGFITKDSSPGKSAEYLRAARNLSRSLNFIKFYQDLEMI
ncbi:hypothetical protein MASR1M45_31400 [Candidatus Kapaibacterium sp.]